MSVIGKVQIKGFDIEWKIENFSELKTENGYYDSPEFFYDGESWFLGIAPNSYSYDLITSIFLYLHKNSSSPPISVMFSLALKTVNGKKSLEKQCSADFRNSRVYICQNLVARSELEKRKAELLPSDVLTVVCTIQTSKSAENANTNNHALRSCVRHEKSKIHQDFKKLFEDKEDCDVVIKVKETEFPAHKAILKVRSPVFASTLRHEMKEKQTGVINVHDCEPSIFSVFLCYLYCEELDSVSDENVFGLYSLADIYDVPDLRDICREFMEVNLSIETFCDTITLALKYSETELVKFCTDFFIKNAQKITETVKWLSFLAENPTQSNELFIKPLASNKN